ncbi:zinc-dependent metalloprotease [Roseivirga sp. BDSF3-8]|uniref:zinc-dependent metalloprotease n=1 Tax=Roseivirga sp. BDSF3-8 TaxID=3241598 RepID=UPI0035323E4E
MNRLLIAAACMVAMLPACSPPPASSSQTSAEKSEESISVKTKGMQKYEGYFTYYWDEKEGKIWLEVDKWDKEFLYVNALAAGVGSNDLGLDRGQLGDNRVVKFQRSGNKVLLVQPNYGYRADSDNLMEQKSVEEAFAQSVLYGFKAEATDEGKALIDMTAFLLRDAHQVGNRLSSSKQGTYKPDESRSAIYLPRTKNFPENSEFEANVTFVGKDEGAYIRSVTPSADAVTVRMHHSFVMLPDDGYEPRSFDPRSGFFYMSYQDYATPIEKPLVKRLIARHRLEKKDPSAAMSEAVEPIVYFLDPGVPEPVKSALIEGASWWNQAFEAAGYQDAFQVKVLPDSVDPLDVRYNVIQWVHRSTRGWSYGASVVDPRTGEILKGHVSLGSLRVRQDLLIAQGLKAAYDRGDEVPEEALEMALARLRQLSAHEVGHTIGLAHNYAASVNGRASVMDYPHPLITLDVEGNIDLSNAYDTGIGEWDKVAVTYGYGAFDSDKEMIAVLEGAIADSLLFITDQDARPQGGAHPVAHLWDNGKSATEELNRVMKVRERALQQLSEKNIPTGAPLATLEEVLVPMYLFHRYQVEAAVKLVGGLNYTYAVRGDAQQPVKAVPGKVQRDALEALLATISPEALRMPDPLLKMLPPRPFGYPRTRETFRSRTGLTFDALSAAETAADLTLSLLFHPERAGRLVQHHAYDGTQPGLNDVLDALMAETWNARSRSGYEQQIQLAVRSLVLDHLISLAKNPATMPQAKAIAHARILDLRQSLSRKRSRGSNEQAHVAYSLMRIDQYLENPEEWEGQEVLDTPDGSPIGSGEMGCH